MVAQLAFGAGTFCIGSSLTMAIIFALAGRNSESGNRVEGCFNTFICLSVFTIGVAFFVAGLVSATT